MLARTWSPRNAHAAGGVGGAGGAAGGGAGGAAGQGMGAGREVQMVQPRAGRQWGADGAATLVDSLAVSYKTEHTLTHGPAVLLLGSHLRS